MNILSLGNSFSLDAAAYIHQIGESIGEDINIFVLHIPGCPINRHWKNYLSKEKEYDLFINGNKVPVMKCDIFEGLNYAKYDYVTFQQRSDDSGDATSFFPELTLLMENIRKYTNGTYLLHKTWSYRKTYTHPKYGHDPLDQEAMDKDIKEAYLKVSKQSGIKYIIPSGEAIRLAREIYGDNLNRDGFHLNERGRTLLGILWVMYLTGRSDLSIDKFSPTGYTYDEVTPPIDKKEIPELIKIAKETLSNNIGYNMQSKTF